MFKVGDIITGLKGNGYNLTTEHATMKVVRIQEGGSDMWVRILSHTTKPNYVGTRYLVDNSERSFKLASKGRVVTAKIVGNKVTGMYGKRLSKEDKEIILKGVM